VIAALRQPEVVPSTIEDYMADTPRIVNIINFIRAVEPRGPLDLLEPLDRQIELVTRHGLPATWLLQHDALIEPRFTDPLKALPPGHEIGVWLEIVQPLVERAGLTWRGRFPWDWHSHVGFSVGYTPEERLRLMDVLMADFHRVFGRYPASAGCWLLDAHTLGYLHDRYGVSGACICKDQWGTDGYTLWGGYWNQAYYPSRRNAFMPAQSASAQIPVPVFRMLGSDPIYQYSAGLFDGDGGAESQAQGVVSLEPVYKQGGGDPAWVRWFFDTMTRSPALAFGYAQAGQENSFGWSAMAAGLTDQVALLARMRRDGQVRVETLGQSASWFRRMFPVTPATAVVAMDDWKGQGRQSAWYDSRFYRVNLFWSGGAFGLRDIHKFDDRYAERYLAAACTSPASTYDTLPLVDGFLSSGPGATGLRLLSQSTGAAIPAGGEIRTAEQGENLAVKWALQGGDEITVLCRPEAIELNAAEGWMLELAWKPQAVAPYLAVDGRRLLCRHEGFDYAVSCPRGRISLDIAAHRLRLFPEAGRLALDLSR
jgi:hypothetical protein